MRPDLTQGRRCGPTTGSASQRGVTLIEMLLVVTLIGLLAAVSYPSVSSGLEGLRLATAADSVAGFLSGAVNRAERREEPLELTVDGEQGLLVLRGVGARFERRLELAHGVRVAAVYPETAWQEDRLRRFYFYPGGAVPRLVIELENAKGARRQVALDPVTGAPVVTRIPGP